MLRVISVPGAAAGRWLRSIKPERRYLRADLMAGLPGAISSVPDGMAAAQQWLVRTWDTALAAYAAEVSRRRSEPRSRL